MENILYGQEQRPLASTQAAGMWQPIHGHQRLFSEGGRDTVHLLLKSTLEFAIQTFTNTTMKKKPSENTFTHPQSRKTNSLMILLSCSFINKVVGQPEIKSYIEYGNAGMSVPTDLVPIKMGH
jgi:hypothetical protein